MLEALFQASCWLVRSTENFDHSVLTMKEARNVKFADFMSPGQTLTITAEFVKIESDTVTIKAFGTKGETVAVSARLIIGKTSLEKSDVELVHLDEFMRESMRERLEQLMIGH